jgi:hypothetical protein
MKIDGGCHCGYITNEAEADPANAMICHCTDCQTLSGSAFRTVLLTQQDSFKLRSGECKSTLKEAKAAPNGHKRSVLNVERQFIRLRLERDRRCTPFV